MPDTTYTIRAPYFGLRHCTNASVSDRALTSAVYTSQQYLFNTQVLHPSDAMLEELAYLF